MAPIERNAERQREQAERERERALRAEATRRERAVVRDVLALGRDFPDAPEQVAAHLRSLDEAGGLEAPALERALSMLAETFGPAYATRVLTGRPGAPGAGLATDTALPHRAEMERLFGEDFSSVRAAVDPCGHLAREGARAAATEDAVIFDGPQPERAVVAHELAHVVQLRRHGTPTGGALAAPSGAAEREAHGAAAAVVSGRAPHVATPLAAAVGFYPRGHGLPQPADAEYPQLALREIDAGQLTPAVANRINLSLGAYEADGTLEFAGEGWQLAIEEGTGGPADPQTRTMTLRYQDDDGVQVSGRWSIRPAPAGGTAPPQTNFDVSILDPRGPAARGAGGAEGEEAEETPAGFGEAAEGALERDVPEAERAGFERIEQANERCEAGRFMASTRGTVSGAPASLGRSQILVQQQVAAMRAAMRSDPDVARQIAASPHAVTQAELAAMERRGRAAIAWYRSVARNEEQDGVPEAARTLAAAGDAAGLQSAHGAAFASATGLAASELRLMVASIPMTRHEYSPELPAIRRTIAGFLSAHRQEFQRLRGPRIQAVRAEYAERLRTLRQSAEHRALRWRERQAAERAVTAERDTRLAQIDREVTMEIVRRVLPATATAPEGADERAAQAAALQYALRQGFEAMPALTFASIRPGGDNGQELIGRMLEAQHAELRTLTAAHPGASNRLTPGSVARYASDTRMNEDMNGWYTAAARTHPAWSRFEALLPEFDRYSSRSRSIANYGAAESVARGWAGFDALPPTQREILLGQLSRIHHAGTGYFHRILRSDDVLGRVPASVADYRETLQRIWTGTVAEPRRVGPAMRRNVQTALTAWTRHYRDIAELPAGADTFLPSGG